MQGLDCNNDILQTQITQKARVYCYLSRNATPSSQAHTTFLGLEAIVSVLSLNNDRLSKIGLIKHFTSRSPSLDRPVLPYSVMAIDFEHIMACRVLQERQCMCQGHLPHTIATSGSMEVGFISLVMHCVSASYILPTHSHSGCAEHSGNG